MKLTETEWQAIKSSYESSTRKGFEQLAIEFGVARTTIARRAKVENWCKKRTEKRTVHYKESIEENAGNLQVVSGKYDTEYADKAYNLSLAGFTIEQIAISFGVSVNTIKNWRLKYQDFNDAIIKGCDHSDGLMAKALFDVGIGSIKVVEEKEVMHPVTGEIVTLETRRTALPNVKAIIHWMFNREKLKDYWSNGEGKNNDLTLEIDATEVIDTFNEEMNKAREKYNLVMEKRRLQQGITIDGDIL